MNRQIGWREDITGRVPATKSCRCGEQRRADDQDGHRADDGHPRGHDKDPQPEELEHAASAAIPAAGWFSGDGRAGSARGDHDKC
jgi:hypothetical protein